MLLLLLLLALQIALYDRQPSAIDDETRIAREISFRTSDTESRSSDWHSGSRDSAVYDAPQPASTLKVARAFSPSRARAPSSPLPAAAALLSRRARNFAPLRRPRVPAIVRSTISMHRGNRDRVSTFPTVFRVFGSSPCVFGLCHATRRSI